jgi:saccharopine dehydrogenase-like NADP-dependent oxidoreductase
MDNLTKKPNLLILGASGGVGNALLIYLGNHRDFFGRIVLMDRSRKLLSNKFINHKKLDYVFINKKISLPKEILEYKSLLKDNSINIVLDITDDNNLPVFYATNEAGVSYINTSLNGSKKIQDQVFQIWNERDKLNNATHILCAGMNPGIVNMWARYGIEKFGIPKQITIFEYDTSKTAKKTPLVTWSIKHFLEEVCEVPSIIMNGRNNCSELFPNALENSVNMKKILEPVLKLDNYPIGFIVPHEEVVSLAQKYDVPVKFVYSINRKTMQTLIKIYEEKGKVDHSELMLGDNTDIILEGSDKVGIMLDYDDKKVYYLNSLTNFAVKGTNATYTQVVIGIIAAFFTLILDKPEKGVYFVEDLHNSYYEQYVFDKMQVQEFVFTKEKDRLILDDYNPEVRVRRKNPDCFCNNVH